MSFGDFMPLDEEIVPLQTVISAPPPVWCDRCDGVGWMEGDEPLGVACKKCEGAGTLA
jgi:DnaJ-class molecular chaperone